MNCEILLILGNFKIRNSKILEDLVFSKIHVAPNSAGSAGSASSDQLVGNVSVLNEVEPPPSSPEAEKIWKKYNLGIISTYEYNDIKNKLNTAESELIRAKYDYLFKIKIIDFYMGETLNL